MLIQENTAKRIAAKKQLLPHWMPNVESAYRRKIYIVGGGPQAADVYNCLSEIPVERILIEDLQGFAKKIDSSAIGIVFAGTMFGLDDAIKTLKNSETLAGLPIHVVSTNSFKNDAAMELYAKGVASVVAFPREKKIFTNILCEMQKRGPKFQANAMRDRRISKAVWARANATLNSVKKFKIWYHNGIVYFVGRLQSISQKERLERVVEAAPGVEKIIDSGMEVPQTEAVDREIEEMVDKAIEMTPGVAPETLTHTVTEGNILIAGCVGNRNGLKRLDNRLRNIFGVRSISNLAAVSKDRSEIDLGMARKIKNSIDKFFIHSKVEVTVMKKVAILEGQVNQHSKKDMIEELARQHAAVKHIINKIDVRSQAT